MNEVATPSERTNWGLMALLLLGVALRIGAMIHWNEDLSQDRDAYLGLATSLQEGRGLATPGTETPTAFRPPLYPLWLSLDPTTSLGRWVAISNLLFGWGTILLTYHLGRRLGLSEGRSTLAAGLIAIDPLLLRYSAQPMTECFSTLLATALLWHLARPGDSQSRSIGSLFTGLLFGANVLCRPTFWAFGGLLLFATVLLSNSILAKRFLFGEPRLNMSESATASSEQRRLRLWNWKGTLLVMLGIVLTVGPWGVRNAKQLGSPIITTTHGGYTLLLGNNAPFYKEVVRQPWGTVWDGSHGPGQEGWYRDVLQQMQADGVTSAAPQVDGISTEVAADRWQQRLAKESIAADPGGFVHASLLRFVRFWNVVPLGDPGGKIPATLWWGTGLFYGLLFAAALVALVRLKHLDSPQLWLPPIAMIVAFTLVHLVYWSNTRMRAPLMPSITLLALSSWPTRKVT
ncbi:MAG: hypothetical protein R3C01_06405 [Planctomycetaceae bacterium]